MNEDRKVLIGGKEYIYADWTAGPLQKIMPLIYELSNLDPSDVSGQLRITVKVLHLAMRRDYPELTEDYINDWLLVPDETERVSELAVEQMSKLSKKKEVAMSTPMTNQSIGEESTPE